jgi:hypothetical protein
LRDVVASQIIHADDVKTDQRPEMLKNEGKIAL